MDLLHQIWYLYDGSLGGSSEKVFEDFKSIIDHSPSLGLELNFSKCELFTAGMPTNEVDETLAKFRSVAPAIQNMQCETASLLGAPLTTAAMPLLLREKTEALEAVVSRLQFFRLMMQYTCYGIVLQYQRCYTCFKLHQLGKQQKN